MFFLALIIFLLSFPKVIFAADEFDISQQIRYQINESGQATVTQHIELTNNYSQIYPKEYQITLSSNKIENITGSDDLGNIIQKIDQQNDSTSINIVFNQANTGKGQITKFNLSYNIKDLAQSKGNTWEIALPENQSAGHQNQTETYINIPSSFGNLSFASVSPQNNITLNNQTELYFKSISKAQKILLIFGDYQLFDFKFKYFLKNDTFEVKEMSVPFPPETDSQKITYRSINPTPKNIEVDNDGNFLAKYVIPPSQEIEINLDGQAKIIHTNLNYAEIKPQLYTTSKLFWETNNSSLITIASQLKTVKDIYTYVVNTLNYKTNNYDSASRQGAAMAITFPQQSLCTEFTDLFVTLCRIKGIPAREVEGFAYSNNTKIKPVNINTDVLHAWPQYYDSSKQAWVSIDPTWEKTTNGVDYFNDLDPNHFAFVFHGLDSQQPTPPGSYKNNQNIRTVNVEFAKNEIKTELVPLTFKTTSKLIQPSKISIFNPNPSSISPLTLSINSINYQKSIKVIPPFSVIEINIPNTSFLKSLNPNNYKVQFSYNGNKVDFKISFNQLYLNWLIVIAGILTLIGFGGIIFIKLKHL
jgi:hypothetical protein